MVPYRRPHIDDPVFRDDDGQIIAYGERWPGAPPEAAYSAVSNPERYGALHLVADALLSHLRATYAVSIHEGDEAVADLLIAPPSVLRAVRVTPDSDACAALTFVYTAFPGIILHAGELHDFAYPLCGCDACDSRWQDEAASLEGHVLSVVEGRYREVVTATAAPEVRYWMTTSDGSESGTASATEIAPTRLHESTRILAAVTSGWSAWPRREEGARFDLAPRARK